MQKEHVIRTRIIHSLKVGAYVLEVLVFAALPIAAFGLSGRYTEHDRLVQAGDENLTMCGDVMEHLTEKNAVPANASAVKGGTETQNEDIDLPHSLTLRGIVNTGQNISGIYDAEERRKRTVLKNAVYNETAFLEAEYVPEEYAETLVALARDDMRVADILACAELYPEEILKMLAKYPETVSFAEEYLYEKDTPAADTIGTVRKGEIPLLLQWDKRWGYAEYGDFLIATTGCGPTCVAMVAAGLTGDVSITPKVVADYAEEHGYYESGVGSKWTLMTEGAENFGIKATELNLDETVLYSRLEAGSPVICSVGPGDFTTNGHFIVLAGVEDGKIRVNDPNSIINSGRLWTYQELASQICNLWAFELQ